MAAGKSGAPLVIVAGEDELESGSWTVKRMDTGEQERVKDDELETYLAAGLDDGKES